MKRWWALLGISASWSVIWMVAPLVSSEPERQVLCVRFDAVQRGVYHVHAIGHDGRDRSEELRAAADDACLDRVIVTNHGGEDAAIHDGERFSDGAEWTRPGSGHHLGQLGGAQDLAEDMSLRVLNHPAWSGVSSPDELESEELELLRLNRLALEVLNGVRLWRTPSSNSARGLALLVGPGRLDLAQAALSLPGPDVQLWDALMARHQRPVPMICGSDAHGHFTAYSESLTVWTLYAPRRLSLEEAVATGDLFCVNELMGSPGPVQWELDGCTWSVEPGQARWRLLRDGHEVRRGVGAVRAAKLSRGGVYRVELWREVDLGWVTLERLWALGGAKATPGDCET